MGEQEMSDDKDGWRPISGRIKDINELNKVYVRPLQMAIHELTGQLYYYCTDNGHTVKQIAQQLKNSRMVVGYRRIEDLMGDFDVEGRKEDDLIAQHTVSGCDFRSVKDGLHHVAREWISRYGGFIQSKHAMGLGIDLDINSNHTTIYAAARFF